jgi:hypothetical protein
MPGSLLHSGKRLASCVARNFHYMAATPMENAMVSPQTVAPPVPSFMSAIAYAQRTPCHTRERKKSSQWVMRHVNIDRSVAVWRPSHRGVAWW